VAIYTRVSTEEQASGHSLDTQRDTLCTWAQSQGWAVTGVYEDPGVSGVDARRRPAFQHMVADAEAGGFDAVLVLRYDRFARSTRDSATYRERLEAAGAVLISYAERTDEGPAGFLTRGMHELLAEY
jgi:DNA invertase Pin-like site-specific DNA recombinase